MGTKKIFTRILKCRTLSVTGGNGEKDLEGTGRAVKDKSGGRRGLKEGEFLIMKTLVKNLYMNY